MATQIFFEGLLLGLGAAMPIGPVNIVIMNEALKNYRKAVAVGLGAMGADLLYLTAAALGLAPFLQIPWVQALLGIAGMLFLALLGVMLFLHRNDNPSVKMAPIDANSLLKAFFKGMMLTLTNPYTVGFWLSVMAMGIHGSLVWLITGLACAILLWVIGMPWMVHRHRHRMSQKLRGRINISAAAILVLFALLLLVRTLA